MRKRTVFSAVAIMSVALVLAGLVLLVVLRTTLVSNARDLAVEQLGTVVEQIQSGDSEGYAADMKDSGAEVAQVLGPDGTVVAATKGAIDVQLYGGPALAPGKSYVSGTPGLTRLLDFDDYMVAARGVSTPSGDVVVVVGAPTTIERDAVSTVGWILLVGVPVLLVLAGMLMWYLIGRALEPVERLRSTVAGITQRNLDGRVDLPNTGDEIDRLARTMNDMLARLQKADESQRRFVTDASHELRSPLASLVAGLEVAAADPTGRTWLDSAAMLQVQALRMGSLIEDLLTLAKIDDSGSQLRMSDVDLDDVLHEEVRRVRLVSKHRFDTSLVPVRMTGDAHRLAQVFRNLVNNADRHAAQVIRVSLAVLDDEAIIRVDNDGDQIPEADRERVFDRFVRLDASRARESGGSGLGLAISQEIVLAHGGNIHVADGPEGFTRLVVALPLRPHDH
ncbi:ATP-binding protein [Arthrobacter sp.]|uniref:sensor histidine kinase n=1 Tax=Arthrobacter sp. TaxID=1667 RepID=UPI003A8CBB04